MGSQICKGSGVEVEVEVEVDVMFPIQSKNLLRLDWTDDLALSYICAENCRHNNVLGKLLRKHSAPHCKKKESRLSLKFADEVDQVFVLDGMITVVPCSQTYLE